MRISKVALVVAVSVFATLSFAVETIEYNGSTWHCQHGCIVEGGSVRDTQGGWTIEIRQDHDDPPVE